MVVFPYKIILVKCGSDVNLEVLDQGSVSNAVSVKSST